MPQLFHPRANTIARAGLLGVVLLVVAGGWTTYAIFWSPYTTRVGMRLDQPVQFSHQHHVDGLGIDCRFCHTSVETSASAGMPPTETCMTCHSQIWKEAPILAAVRESLARNQPLRWQRVHDLPDFVFFNHSIHVNKGIGCVTCHGRVDQLPLMEQEQTLYMKWCLDCHENPAAAMRPRTEVFNLAWSSNSPALQRELMGKNHPVVGQLRDCSICHR